MAHIKKISISAAPNMIAHDFRQPQKEEYPFYKTRFHVNDDLSNLNEYHFSNEIDSPEKVFDGYIEELHKCKMQKRSDINTIVSVVVHLPQDVEAGTEEEKLFFDETRKFLQERWKDTYFADAIHRDENRPHMHYLLIPKVNEIKNEKVRDPKTGKLKKTGRKIETGRKKISVKELISRDDVTRFHNDLNEHMKKVFGREIEILNGITAENGGNKTVSELKLNTARENAEAAKIAAEKEKEHYRKLSANFDQAKAKKIQEFEQRERKISEAEASVAKAQSEAAKTLQEANAKGEAADAKAAQLRQEEAQLQQRLKAVADAQAKADKKFADAEEQRRAADDALAAVNEAKINAQKEAARIISNAKNEAEQTRRAADAALATAEEKTKTVQIREKSVSKREAALEETRPDIKAARLNREIKAIATEISTIEALPQSEKDIDATAYAIINPEIGINREKHIKMVIAIKTAAENHDFDVIYDNKKYDRLVFERKAQSLFAKICDQKREIDDDPQKRVYYQQLQKDIKQKTLEEQKRLPELRAKYEQKCEEYAFYGGAAVDLLIKAAPKWQEIAPEIEAICRKYLLKEKANERPLPAKNRGFER